MTALHLFVVVLTVVTAVAEYSPPYPTVGKVYKPTEYKPTYAPDYKKPEYPSKPAYPPVYDGNQDYKKPEYPSKPAYPPVYDGNQDYKKPEYPVYEDKPYGEKSTGADVRSAIDAVGVLITKKDELYTNLDIYETLIQVAAERLNLINQRELPAVRLDISQTDASITLLDQEVNTLRDRAARADVTATAALASANATSDVIRQQRALVAQISKNNTDDARRIAQFQGDLRNLEAYFLKELDTQIGQLTSLLAKERQNLKTVTAFVDGRKCEYGYVALTSNADTASVQFVTKFNQAPSVDIVLSGYASFLNVRFAPRDSYPPGNNYPPQSTYGEYPKGDDSSYKNEVQNVQVVVSDVTEKGFTARVINSSPVNFYFGQATAKYVACQNLNSEVY
ncbi:uncharacterized protein LOC112561403 isoform X2 [Pomacea canaliculata]|uniref:uncharacterized protein LOC112561403 isoform X2 n=1 Tax=Pomacea canaliculata TaxID=400727 RepID=UPI000D72E37D|nr:uncharacterized protein LOC112561403 isoform X2 [Pomacea canaliculata]